MNAWAVHGVELPFGDEIRSWWVDAPGAIHDRPLAGAEPLPGRFVLPGLADAHAHPAVGAGPTGLVALGESAARANLTAWAKAGITVVRDTGSPLASGSVAAAGALLAVLFLAAQPARPIQLARPAGSAAGEAETAEGAREAKTQPHPAAAAR